LIYMQFKFIITGLLSLNNIMACRYQDVCSRAINAFIMLTENIYNAVWETISSMIIKRF